MLLIVIEEGDRLKGIEENCFSRSTWWCWDSFSCLEGNGHMHISSQAASFMDVILVMQSILICWVFFWTCLWFHELVNSVWKWFIVSVFSWFFEIAIFRNIDLSFWFMWFFWLWQLLLGYLSPDRSLWSSELAKKRSQYKQFKEELLMNPVSPFWWFDIPTLHKLVCEEKLIGWIGILFCSSLGEMFYQSW